MRKIIQNIFIHIITLCVLCFNFKTVVLQYEYIFDNENFTEKYCSNIKKPELKCNGKCHLKKINTEKDPQNTPKKTFFDIEIVFFNNVYNYNFKDFIKKKKKRKYFNVFLIEFIDKHPIDHPPQSLV